MAFHNHHQQLSQQDLTTFQQFPDVHSSPPNWLSTTAPPIQNTNNFLHLSNSPDSSSAATPQPQPPPPQWPGLLHVESFSSSLDLKDALPQGDAVNTSKSEGGDWQAARSKAEILSHPLYEQLLSAHVACLRIATPVDQLPRIDAQLAQSQNVVAKYSALSGGPPGLVADDNKELDHFMTHYVLLLCSFKEQLQQHVRVHAMEAVMACWEIEQSLQSLTGVSPGEGTGATMSDDEDHQVDSDANLFNGSLDGTDTLGFGPLIPTESERSLMERVRQELKHELKKGYKEKIIDIREEILRKRRAGKLPGDTTSVLKSWWQSHSKWPYPTEEDKVRLVQETGLHLKQINNWFINQRKRNWHSNPSTSSVSKSKRKRYTLLESHPLQNVSAYAPTNLSNEAMQAAVIASHRRGKIQVGYNIRDNSLGSRLELDSASKNTRKTVEPILIPELIVYEMHACHIKEHHVELRLVVP